MSRGQPVHARPLACVRASPTCSLAHRSSGQSAFPASVAAPLAVRAHGRLALWLLPSAEIRGVRWRPRERARSRASARRVREQPRDEIHAAGALGRTRTPDLLIRSPRHGVRIGPHDCRNAGQPPITRRSRTRSSVRLAVRWQYLTRQAMPQLAASRCLPAVTSALGGLIGCAAANRPPPWSAESAQARELRNGTEFRAPPDEGRHAQHAGK